ncbi:hypothetical protein JMN32_18995 [Fulvivirga sp. 29W222]|uniref:DUF2953 domain-containing protein n=1 Tax=Fulvivirga marina TaxID=2494733 RepID=A0A937G0S3_9BACT|nr:hypothetical protein [Fulvivirga marina]MBL6448408.1 hypothetical protein [Fulvivirga marina]
MLVIYILLLAILVLLLWIVFTPLYVRVDTTLGLYEIHQAGTINMSLHPGEDEWWQVRVFGVRVRVKASEKPKKAKTPKKQGKGKKKSRFKRSASAWRCLVSGVVRSITLQQFACSVDLDNVVLNAQLVPVLMLVNRGPVSIHTNFNDQYYLQLRVKARLNRLIWTFIRFLTKK